MINDITILRILAPDNHDYNIAFNVEAIFQNVSIMFVVNTSKLG